MEITETLSTLAALIEAVIAVWAGCTMPYKDRNERDGGDHAHIISSAKVRQLAHCPSYVIEFIRG